MKFRIIQKFTGGVYTFYLQRKRRLFLWIHVYENVMEKEQTVENPEATKDKQFKSIGEAESFAREIVSKARALTVVKEFELWDI